MGDKDDPTFESRLSILFWLVLEYDYLPMTDHGNKHDLVYPPNLRKGVTQKRAYY